MDLCASSSTILKPEDGVQVLSTGISGPPPKDTYFLILGRASTTLSDLTIHPSLVDNDYTGEIKILASAPQGPITITQGQRLAQALSLPLDTSQPALNAKRGPSKPGSSDLYWVQAITKERPMLTLKIQGKRFKGILDSGADSTVISRASWPSSWPVQASLTHLQGIGQSKNTLQSSQLLTWEDEEGNTGTTQPFVVPGLPVNLWGRDILSQMKVIMCSPNDIVTHQMLAQGYLPGRGLGKTGQGDPNPVMATPKPDRSGLGFNNHFL